MMGKTVMDPARLKTELVMMGAETEVGFRADQQAAARIRDLTAALEAHNPTASPVAATRLLRGHWKLVYSNLELRRRTTLAKFSFNILPDTPVHVAELFNQIDPATGLWDNVIRFEDMDNGTAGTLVVAGQYFVVDEQTVELEFASAIVTTTLGQVITPITREQLPPIPIRTTYLDDGFRVIRSARGSLYILERMDAAPMAWARHL